MPRVEQRFGLIGQHIDAKVRRQDVSPRYVPMPPRIVLFLSTMVPSFSLSCFFLFRQAAVSHPLQSFIENVGGPLLIYIVTPP